MNETIMWDEDANRNIEIYKIRSDDSDDLPTIYSTYKTLAYPIRTGDIQLILHENVWYSDGISDIRIAYFWYGLKIAYKWVLIFDFVNFFTCFVLMRYEKSGEYNEGLLLLVTSIDNRLRPYQK